MPKNRPYLALGLRLAAAAILATQLAMVKYGSERGVSLAEFAFWRQFTTVIMLSGYLLATKGFGRLRTKRFGTHVRRSVLGMITLCTNFLTSIMLPLAVATTLSFTTPLFAVVLAALIFKEAVGPWRWAAVMLGFFGVIVIAQPGSTSTESISLFGAGLGLLNALMVAIVSLQIRDLGRSESTLTMTFYFAAIGTPIAAVFLPFYASAHEAWLWATMLSVGVLGTICQMCMAASLRFGPVSTVIPMDYSSIVWATLLGWLIWNHLPGASMLLGAPLIIASGLLIVWREHRHHRQPPPATSAIVD